MSNRLATVLAITIALTAFAEAPARAAESATQPGIELTVADIRGNGAVETLSGHASAVAQPLTDVTGGIFYQMSDNEGAFNVYGTLRGANGNFAIPENPDGTSWAYLVANLLTEAVGTVETGLSAVQVQMRMGISEPSAALAADPVCALWPLTGLTRVIPPILGVLVDATCDDQPVPYGNASVYWSGIPGNGLDVKYTNSGTAQIVTDLSVRTLHNQFMPNVELTVDLHFWSYSKRLVRNCDCDLTTFLDYWTFYSMQAGESHYHTALVTQYTPFSGPLKLGNAVRTWIIE